MWTFWNEQFYSNEQTSVRQLPETLDILVVHLHLNKWLDPWENFWLVAGGWGSLKCSLVGHLTTWTANITGKFDQNFSKKWDAWACTEAQQPFHQLCWLLMGHHCHLAVLARPEHCLQAQLAVWFYNSFLVYHLHGLVHKEQETADKYHGFY